MASLKDLQFSQMGEQPTSLVREGSVNEAEMALQAAPSQLGETYKIYKLSDTKKNGNYHMNCIDDVWNPKTERMERIRLLRGFDSIFLKDQTGLDKDFIERNRRSLQFNNRILRVPSWDKAAIDYLERSNANVDNPNRKGTRKLTFFEWNPVRIAEADRKKRVARIAAIKAASEATVDSMKKHANYLGLSFVDELGFPKSEDALRNDYELYAESQPTKFMQSLGSPEIEVAYLVKRAILDSKIDLAVKPGSAYWASDGGFICKIPTGVQPNEYIVEFAMLTTDESKQFLSQLKQNAK